MQNPNNNNKENKSQKEDNSSNNKNKIDEIMESIPSQREITQDEINSTPFLILIEDKNGAFLTNNN